MKQTSFGEYNLQQYTPLADRIRPETLEEIIGQEHLTAPQSPIFKALKQGRSPSLILVGDPGTGKTTLARVLGRALDAEWETLNAVTDGVGQLREVIEKARNNQSLSRRTILFVDEIARWNKAQQDALLPHVENGLIILYGATTEHPSSLNPALASRCRIEVLHPLDDQALHKLLQRALDHPKGCRGPYGELVHVSPEACEYLVKASAQDGRQLLSLLEAALSASDGPEVSLQTVQLACTNEIATRSDRGDLVSALIKSVRGSNPSASLYWMAQLESRGEDPLYLARRLLIQASEDIGLARPGALTLAQSGYEAVRVLGPPEAWIVIAETVCYLAQCPKSWASTQGLQNAREAVSQHPHPTVPPHLRSHSLSGYRHPSEGDGGQAYLPKELEGLALLPKS